MEGMKRDEAMKQFFARNKKTKWSDDSRHQRKQIEIEGKENNCINSKDTGATQKNHWTPTPPCLIMI